MKKSIYSIATALAIVALSACTPAPISEDAAFLTEDQVAQKVADDGGTIYTINEFLDRYMTEPNASTKRNWWSGCPA